MPLFTADQIRRVREIVRRYHQAMGVAFFGPQAAEEVAAELRRQGLVPDDAADLYQDPYAYAQLLGRLADPDLMSATPAKVLQTMADSPAPPLTPVERAQADAAARHAGEYLTGLGDRVSGRIMGAITGLEGGLTKEEVQAVVASSTERNRIKRESISKLKSDLGAQVGEWRRDWLRVATTESNNAIQNGLADSLEAEHGDPRVSKLPRPDACPKCMELYTDGGTPKIFRLSQLRANGSNVGRKQAAWKPTLEAIHPWCACVLVRIPDGFRWEGRELVPDDTAKSYKLHYRTTFQGLPISIENRQGSIRRWTDESGREGETKIRFPYGYIRRTEGADGDHIDCYIGPDKESKTVYVVHQKTPNRDGVYTHDEDKVFLGFANGIVAKKAFLAHVDDAKMFGSMTSLSMDRFKKVLERNEGKKLRMVKAHRHGEWIDADTLLKSIPMVSRAILDLIDFGTPAPAKLPQLVQGADNIPKKTRASQVAGLQDELGLTPEGRKKKRKKKGEKDKIRSEQAKRKREALEVFDLIRTPHGQDGDVAEGRRYVPDLLREARKGSRDLVDHKIQAVKDQAERRRGHVVSEVNLRQEYRRQKRELEAEDEARQRARE